MSSSLFRPHRAKVAFGLMLAAVLALSACGSSDDDTTTTTAADATSTAADPGNDTETGDETGETPEDTAEDAAWPRPFTNADGTITEIPGPPQNILSTSVSVTGTLLAIEAPVVASGSNARGDFFAQWADVAIQRDVTNVWPAGSVDIEAAFSVTPDLIIVSTSGADSALEQLPELQAIAPTIVVDYGGQTWQELAVQLGEATGLEIQVADLIAAFDAYVADAAGKITVPAGQANVISFNGPGEDNPIGKNTGTHAQLLAALGFAIEEPDQAWHTQDTQRADFVWTAFENLTQLTAETTFLLSRASDDVDDFVGDPVLANLASVQSGQVYGLGVNSFRIDYFSATELVDGVVANFGN